MKGPKSSSSVKQPKCPSWRFCLVAAFILGSFLLSTSVTSADDVISSAVSASDEKPSPSSSPIVSSVAYSKLRYQQPISEKKDDKLAEKSVAVEESRQEEAEDASDEDERTIVNVGENPAGSDVVDDEADEGTTSTLAADEESSSESSPSEDSNELSSKTEETAEDERPTDSSTEATINTDVTKSDEEQREEDEIMLDDSDKKDNADEDNMDDIGDELDDSFGKQREGEDGDTGSSSRVRRGVFPYRYPRAGPPPPAFPPPPPPPPTPFYGGGPSSAASFLRPQVAPLPGNPDDPNDPFNRRSVLRDRSQCYSGNCEFFAMCWATGGLLSGGCGGFFFSCCVRPGTYIAEHTYNSEPARIQYGPVINDPNCGRSQPYGAQRRIVGGDNAGFGVFPWQAYIRIGKSRCGGSLINRKHVVTAGHCVKRATPSMVQVTLGDYVLGQEIEPLDAQKFGVVDIKVHPKFKYTPQADRYDVAVMTLDRAVEIGPHMAPICLPEKGEDFLAERAWVAGWGAMQPGSRLRPRTLQAVDVPVINNKECEDWHKSKGITVIIYDEMTCAGWRNGGRDACQGDSGGPLMVHRYGRWYLIGLVSAGYSCAQSKQPGIYHRVSYTADWISAVANKNSGFSRHHEDDSADSADGPDGADAADGGFLDDDKEYDYYK